MNWYGFWADVIVAIHVVYVGFVVGGELAVLAGLAFRQRWARNPWFRCIHLAAVLVVAYEFLLGADCPLTTWEATLRGWAGQEFSGETFIARCLHWLIFHDPVNMWIVNLVNGVIGALVILTFVVFPPRFRRAKTGLNSPGGPLTAPPLPG